MKPAKIKLQKKVIVDVHSTWLNANLIHNEAFNELHQLMLQIGPNFLTWEVVMRHSSARIPGLIGMASNAIRSRIETMGGLVPTGWQDTTGTSDIIFENWALQILKIDLRNRNSFELGLHFFSSLHYLVDAVGDKIIIVPENQSENFKKGELLNPLLVSLDNSTTIHSYSQIK